MKICGTAAALVLLLVAQVYSFNGEDKFIKKYAMMKIYESCFGPEVVRQIRREMKAACQKCASYETAAATPPTAPSPQLQPQVQRQPKPPTHPHPHPQATTFEIKDDGITDPQNTLFANAQTFDSEKLHQAILAYRPQSSFMAQPQGIRPYQTPFYAPYANPNPMYYPGTYNQPSPFAAPFGYPFVPQQYFGNNRVSRDMNIRDQLDALTNRVTGRVRNVTCVMQELGYLDENLEPNYDRISERIGNLPVGDELKRDMQDGVVFCQQFSQCVPEVKKEKSPLSRELIRPMFFFKCYKHKKLEACIMKDVREKYSGVSEDDFEGDIEFRRTGRGMKLQENEIDDLANSMYEFLYGSDSGFELDSLL